MMINEQRQRLECRIIPYQSFSFLNTEYHLITQSTHDRLEIRSIVCISKDGCRMERSQGSLSLINCLFNVSKQHGS